MPIKCGLGRHYHDTIAEVRACYGVKDSPVRPDTVATSPSLPAPVQRATPGTRGLATDRQRADATRLRIVLPPETTAADATEIIYTAQRERILAQKAPKKIDLPPSILGMIRHGNFAVSLDGTNNLRFVRITEAKQRSKRFTNPYAGWLKIQTQHSDALQDRAVINQQDARIVCWTSLGPDEIRSILMAIIADQKNAAYVYSMKLGKCCHCNKRLTDARSRHYGIGPECEKLWPDYIAEVELEHGAFNPNAVAEYI